MAAKLIFFAALCLVVIIVLSRTGLQAWFPTATDWGKFTTRPQVEFLEADRKVRLINEVNYIDPGGTTWTTPKGYVSDGASIPQVFWSLVGGPFSGAHRDAAIIHDWYCETMERSSEDTHRVFYYANRAAGLSEFKAKRLYLAVLVGGRKWGSGESSCYSGCHLLPETYSAVSGDLILKPNISENDAKTAMSWFEESNPSLADIENYVINSFPESLFGHKDVAADSTK